MIFNNLLLIFGSQQQQLSTSCVFPLKHSSYANKRPFSQEKIGYRDPVVLLFYNTIIKEGPAFSSSTPEEGNIMLAVLVANHPMKTIRPQESEETKSVSLPLIHIISRQIRTFQTCKSVGLWDFIVPKWNWTSIHQTPGAPNNHGLSHGLHRLPRNMSSHGGETLKISSSFSCGLSLGTALVQRTFGRKKQQNGSMDVVVLYIIFNSIFLYSIMFCLGETISLPPFFCCKRLSAERKTP